MSLLNPTRPDATRKRRSLSAAVLAAGAAAMTVLGTVPAFAATQTVTPSSDGTYTTAGTVSLSASVSETATLRTIKAFEMVFTSVDNPSFSATATHNDVYKKSDTICMAWNPASSQVKGGATAGECPNGPQTMTNGTYKVTSTVWTCSSALLPGTLGCLDAAQADAGPTRMLKVSIAPKTPANVKARLDAAPVVTWNANTEPDLSGYRVIRTDLNKQVGAVLDPKATSWTDPCSATAPCTPGSSMSYKVAAVRKSPIDTPECSKCVLSSYSAATGEVSIPLPPSPAAGDPAAGQPGTQGTAGASSNPLNIPAAAPSPLPAVTAPTKQIILPNTRSDKYAPTLPYAAPLPQDGAAPIQAPAQVEATQAQQQAAAESVTQKQLPKLQFLAGALVLFVAAMHLARGGGMLLKGGSKAAGDARPTRKARHTTA